MIVQARMLILAAVAGALFNACGGAAAPRDPRLLQPRAVSEASARNTPVDERSHVICGGVVDGPQAIGPVVTPTVRWRITTGDRIVATPAEIGGDIVVGSLDGKLYRVSRDGALIATTDTGAPIQAPAGPISSVRDALVGNTAGHLLRITPDGAIVWRLPLHGPVVTAPLFALRRSVYVAADGIYRIDRDGNVLWHHVEATTVYEQPTRTSDGITFSTVDGRNVTLDDNGRVTSNVTRPPVDDNAPPPPPVAVTDRDRRRYYVADQTLVATLGDGTPLWRYSLGANVAGSVLLTSTGTLVVGADDGILYALH